MDYNSIDEDDVENLRLAALMTIKKKSYLPESRIQKSEKDFPSIFAHSSSSYNYSTKNEGESTSNKLFNKYPLRRASFRKSAYSNSNLISIIPSDIKCDFHTDLTNSTPVLTSEDKNVSNIPNLNNEANKVSTKFSRLEHESDSEESEDSDLETYKKEESDDSDILSLGEKDKDLDDLEKLMDIIEAEITNKDNESSKKESSELKTNNNYVVKNATELNVGKNKLIPLNQPKIIEDSKLQLNLPPCTSLKSCAILKSPIPYNRKRSTSPCIKHLNRCSTQVDHSKHQSKSSPPTKLSPIKEKNVSPLKCFPQETQDPSSSLNKTYSVLSQVTLPNIRQLSPFDRISRSPHKRKSRSPNNEKSNSPIKKLKSRLISPTIPRVDSNDNLQKTIKIKSIEKQEIMKQFDSIVKVADDKKLCIQHNDSVDLRTEIKRRRALRLNMNHLDVKRKSESLYPTRLLQSAIKDVVDSSAHEVKRDKCPYKLGIRLETKGDSMSRSVVLLSDNQYNNSDKLEFSTSAKRLKSNFKKEPLHLRVTSIHNNNMKLKGSKKIIRQNINVTDIDQM
ncbi:uncharacterized protein LOC114128252 isoform X1 [Aphis gossypii]|uniref:uncharacterized protein LOC114128252 isoform X1 n=2 Tax=Aphis gossypii TaxID=80765 RepID=UPI00215924D8|nr:uncharacterized protein LOC114128252 isoform X1 [Aphis gossypii]XP_050057755.1 uncharacterized protein LOC114128252 isoform X1 [Aphis gossypii]